MGDPWHDDAMSSDAQYLAQWVWRMTLADQVSVAGATVLLARIKAENPGVFDDLHERRLIEAESSADARSYALEWAERARAMASPDDARRVATLCDMVAEKISA